MNDGNGLAPKVLEVDNLSVSYFTPRGAVIADYPTSQSLNFAAGTLFGAKKKPAYREVVIEKDARSRAGLSIDKSNVIPQQIFKTPYGFGIAFGDYETLLPHAPMEESYGNLRNVLLNVRPVVHAGLKV